MIRFLRRRRLTISRLMLLIAVIALALGGGRWACKVRPEVEHRRWRAETHAREAGRWVENTTAIDRREITVERIPMKKDVDHQYDRTRENFYIMYKTYDNRGVVVYSADHYPQGYLEELTVVCRERAAYHERMRRKWARAAWTPWAAVAPDPPMPPVNESSPRGLDSNY